ncbi:MAG: chromosome partitioning protein, partial [Pseudoclavibacter sp.]|nr:chromosome partitioning protein [Pseudoclavibacter sp.]
DDFLADKPQRAEAPAEEGWRGSLRRSTGGLLRFKPSAREMVKREEIAAIRRTFEGHRSIVVMNPKGGAHKTTATLMIAAMFGMHRGGYTLAWDNNETRGTLGWRSHRGDHDRTAVDLLHQLSHFEISGGATIADVDRFVRNQGEANFDVLASDDDAASAAIIDDEAFSRLYRTLSRFYRVIVIDTGNNMRASNWEAALEIADQLVIVSTAREDTAASAAWLADGLAERGFSDKLANAVTVLSSPSAKEDRNLQQRLREHFSQITRDVVEVPYDHEFVGGGELHIGGLRGETLDAWRRVAAVIARGL